MILAVLFGLSVGMNVLLALGIRRMYLLNVEATTPQEKVGEDGAADALLQVVEASLIDEPDAWASADNLLTHSGGTKVFMRDGVMFVGFGDSLAGVTAEWQRRLLHACKSRNSRAMLNSFREQ